MKIYACDDVFAGLVLICGLKGGSNRRTKNVIIFWSSNYVKMEMFKGSREEKVRRIQSEKGKQRMNVIC